MLFVASSTLHLVGFAAQQNNALGRLNAAIEARMADPDGTNWNEKVLGAYGMDLCCYGRALNKNQRRSLTVHQSTRSSTTTAPGSSHTPLSSSRLNWCDFSGIPHF
jgi:hypothetical protein